MLTILDDYWKNYYYIMLIVNAFGNLYFSHVNCSRIKLWYFEMVNFVRDYNIDHYKTTAYENSIHINVSQDSYKIVFK